MRYLSVCSGIEAASVAWGTLGWEAVGFSEIEAFPSAVLRHHYPAVPNLGDMTKYQEWEIERPDVLVGGTPCQSFSVAGLRKGLADPRGNLALVYCGILDRFKPQWFVWENVPGVLSSGGGRDFGSFLGAVAELGYGFAYRVLDAQFFGVPQRRRRVFVVGYLGDWRPAAAVLFERESLRRDSAPSREKGQEVAPTVGTGAPFSRTGNGSEADALQPYAVANCLTARMHKGINSTLDEGQTPVVAPTITAANDPSRSPQSSEVTQQVWAVMQATQAVAQPMPINTMVALRHEALGRDTGFGIGEAGDPAYTLTKGHSHAVAQPMAFPANLSGTQHASTENLAPSMGAKNPTAVQTAMQVRRLTPVECERLQGFPDNYTNIPWRGKPESPDGPRYKALGNSMAVPVMQWIGNRIDSFEKRT
jgi:DNA (cytosine-5)-methyltransferase 1